MKGHALQYTIRGIPREVDFALRERARQRGMSINQLVIEELTSATVGEKQLADFSGLVGKWTADQAFDEILGRQREVDPDDWA